MPHDDILGTFNLDQVDDDLGPYLFLRSHARRGDQHLVRRDLKRAVARSVLPDRARLVRSIDAGPCFDILVEVDDVLVMLRTWLAAADVWATGSDQARTLAVVQEIQARVPRDDSEQRRVEVRFTDHDSGTRYLDVDVRPWSETRELYSDDVRTALDDLVRHRPARAEARRLLLWHGAPGTGKTTAIRSLLDACRDWADGVIVTDPEALLASGKYLRRTVLDAADDRWQLLVLEDAESLLHKGGDGKGMAKLLNLADGLLGQGLRCLFLITTNEPLGVVHPALVRPGRCLARVEFGPLPAKQASRVLGRQVDAEMTLAEVMAAKPVTVKAAEVTVGQYL